MNSGRNHAPILPLLLSLLTGFAFSTPAQASDILYIGDSHSTGCFGKEIDLALRSVKQGTGAASVVSQASCGSASSHWLKSNGHVTTCGTRICDNTGKCEAGKGRTDSIGFLLAKENPKVTVVALGTNMIKGKRDQVESETRSLILKIKESGSECVWIGPPQAALFFSPIPKFNDFLENLEKIVEAEGCRYISSADKTSRENLNDSMGLHYGCRDAENWGKKVSQSLKPVVEAALEKAAKAATSFADDGDAKTAPTSK